MAKRLYGAAKKAHEKRIREGRPAPRKSRKRKSVKRGHQRIVLVLAPAPAPAKRRRRRSRR
jgi:hypothetical protein